MARRKFGICLFSPNTQSVNEYHTLDKKQWSKYNEQWPEYNVAHQPYLKIDLPPSINSLYGSNYTNFWIESLPNKMKKYIIDPFFEFTPATTTQKSKPSHQITDPVKKYGDCTFIVPKFIVLKCTVLKEILHTTTLGQLLVNYDHTGEYGPQPRPDTDTIY